MKPLKFHRLFSKTMYKNLKLPLCEMTFTKDFVTDTRGDLYPVIRKSTDCEEYVENNTLVVRCGTLSRLIGGFFPYATYEVSACCTDGAFGFDFEIPSALASVTYDGANITFSCADQNETVPYSVLGDSATLIVSCRPSAFDIYFKTDKKVQYVCTFLSDAFKDSHLESNFTNGKIILTVSGNVTVLSASGYIDCGISQADLRPVRFENGDVMTENGKIYLTASIRMQEHMFQGIFAWTPSTSIFELTGALFYDSGDGYWCGDVAASVLYHREKQCWYLWVCAFSHGHILGHSAFEGDIRFGVNVVDITLMEKADADTPRSEFKGFASDEDPDFYYDSANDKWYMAICRKDGNYKYHFFESDSPFDNYKFIGKGETGAETGGSFVTLFGEKVFICGNAFDKTSDYRIYTANGMLKPEFDFADGGFRGWGTVIPVKSGGRIRYFWITFDRHNASAFNWSYGNIYCFECKMQ